MGKMQEKQVTQRTARNSLTEERILDSALLLARKNEHITIRAVADGLNCTPMAIYRHFADKQQLMLALLDRVLSKIDLERKHKSAKNQFQVLATAHLKVLQVNEWSIPLLFKHPAPGEAATKIGEEFLALLKEGGFEGLPAVRKFSALLALNYGWAGFTATANAKPDTAPITNALPVTSPDSRKYPNTAKQWSKITKTGTNDDYQAALQALVLNDWPNNS